MASISFIIPIYNVENILGMCLDSIRSTGIENWECILVDDGSTDGSGAICDRCAEQDKRFKVIHRKNGGVSSARNCGIEHALGDWIWFVDSDDVVDSGPVAKLLHAENRQDEWACMMFGYEIRNEDDTIKYAAPQTVRAIISNEKALAETCSPLDLPYNGYLWNKLFRRDIIIRNHIRFNDRIFYNEDRLFVVEYLCQCRGLCSYYSTDIIYHYYERRGSAMYRITNNFLYDEKFVTDLDAFSIIIKRLRHYDNQQLINDMQDCMMASYRFIMSCAYNSRRRNLSTRLGIAFKMIKGLGLKTWWRKKHQ